MTCGWGCDHESLRFHVVTRTPARFSSGISTSWRRGCRRSTFRSTRTSPSGPCWTRWKQSAKDHDVGAEAVSPLCANVCAFPNRWGDTAWVWTQYVGTGEGVRLGGADKLPPDSDQPIPLTWKPHTALHQPRRLRVERREGRPLLCGLTDVSRPAERRS